MASLRLRLIPWSAVRATKMPPPGPLVARIRLPLASSLSASRSVGRLTPNSAARSSSRPRKSSGPQALLLDVVLDLDGHLLAGAADRPRRRPRRVARAASARVLTARPPGRALVDHPARLAVGARQHAGRDRHDRTRRPSCWRMISCSSRARRALLELDLELDLVHAARLGVEGDAELARAAHVAHGLLDRRRVDVHPADHDHVVGAADDPARQPAVLVPGRAALVGVHHDVAGAVAQHREAGAAQRREHQLAALARRRRVAAPRRGSRRRTRPRARGARGRPGTGSRTGRPRSARRGPCSARRSPPRCASARPGSEAPGSPVQITGAPTRARARAAAPRPPRARRSA